MNRIKTKRLLMFLFGLIAFLPLLGIDPARAAIDGLTGTTFSFTAKSGYITTADGNSILMWGYANGAGAMQHPGPILILNQGSTITLNLANQLTVPVSIVFPGQANVIASGGTQGLLTREAPPGGNVQYTFVASEPGTYTYYSGTNSNLQVEMGLVGVIIVRPTLGATYAYNHPGTQFKREFLFLLTEIDPNIHELVATGQMANVDTTTFFPVYWLINGRSAPDTMSEPNAASLPSQPYDSMVRMHPNERVLIRMVGGNRDSHPFHTHGNHHRVIARDGRLLQSVPGAGPDLGELAFTTTVAPGQTADAFFVWTGEKLGWDIYGHAPGDPPVPGEYMPDHGKPFPVNLPDQKDLLLGQFWSGTPFLGVPGPLPPGDVTLNPTGALTFMWHSHSEKELTNNNIFPGGMLTMAFIEHPSVIIEPNNP